MNLTANLDKALHHLILIVEDEPQMSRFLITLLETSHYRVLEATNAAAAIHLCASRNPNLILLDLGLPDRDGLSVIIQIREWTKTPIIVISAREQENDKVEALDLGADDYLTKPFHARELLARMRAALRHTERAELDIPEFINGPLRIDYAHRLTFFDEQSVSLTPTEYKILTLLAKNAEKVLTYRQILRDVWGQGYVEHTHYVRVFMSQLRQKFEHNPARPQLLITETGVGYRMRLLKPLP
jgi:two-component system KDP operon response regulator KdpE